MTLGVLLAHVAARWVATRTPTRGWVPDESETGMTEHETHVITCKHEQHAYCTSCGWMDIWRPDDGTAYDSAAAHRRKATA